MLAPAADGCYLRLVNELIRPLEYCTASVKVGVNNDVISFTVIPHFIADCILGCNFLSSTGAIIDCGNHELHLANPMSKI